MENNKEALDKYEKAICMNCGEKLDGHQKASESNDPRLPKVGDYSICVYCGNIGTYVEDIETKRIFIKSMEKEELDEIKISDPKNYFMLMKAQEYILNKEI